jgi:hypothetical protein
MNQHGSERRREPRLRGVTELPASLGERRYRARIRQGKGREVNLGLFPTRWLAAFAYNVAAEALHGDRRPRNEIPPSRQPDADQVRAITSRVRRRLGLDGPPPPPDDHPPGVEDLLTLLEITVVGFWRGQVVAQGGDPGRELDLAAGRLVEAARLLFWSHSSGHPTPREALAQLLALRLDRTFRRSDLTREVLDDEGDDPFRLARLLVLPDDLPGVGGFREAIGPLYAELLGETSARSGSTLITWQAVLQIAPPITSDRVRSAYRSRSKALHPDSGGSHAEFVRLQEAYEEAKRYCTSRGL